MPNNRKIKKLRGGLKYTSKIKTKFHKVLADYIRNNIEFRYDTRIDISGNEIIRIN